MATKTVRVEAPDPTFRGLVAGIQFTDGVAELSVDADDRAATAGILGYFQSAGYAVDGKRLNDPTVRPAAVVAAPGTPENRDGITRGASAKDAAVVADAAGPVSDAFLPPTNAGRADPHGPEVVSPGLHAVPPAPIRPGEVHVDDVARQEAAETELARRVLVEQEPATIVASDEPPGGPLGLSDPGSVEAGIRDAEASGIPSQAELANRAAAASRRPARSARVDEWRDFAVAQGTSPEEAAGLTKDELVERYAG